MRQALPLLAAVLLLAGCPKKQNTAVGPAMAPDPYPDLICPEGTEKKGAAPPEGYKVWCMRFLPTGQWQNDGGMVTFYDTGELKERGDYVAGRKEGTWETLYESGELLKEVIYVDNRANGPATEYHPNGTKKAEGEMVDGKEDGHWVYWHDNGNKYKEGVWKDGEPDGTWIEYDEDGTPSRERLYKFGRLLTHKEL